jgi:hypothetical protein
VMVEVSKTSVALRESCGERMKSVLGSVGGVLKAEKTEEDFN